MQDNIVIVVDSLHGSMIKPLRLLFREMSNSFINIKKCPVRVTFLVSENIENIDHIQFFS